MEKRKIVPLPGIEPQRSSQYPSEVKDVFLKLLKLEL
jgi:hypothetical protein